jgi:hypothetical protein
MSGFDGAAGDIPAPIGRDGERGGPNFLDNTRPRNYRQIFGSVLGTTHPSLVDRGQEVEQQLTAPTEAARLTRCFAPLQHE